MAPSSKMSRVLCISLLALCFSNLPRMTSAQSTSAVDSVEPSETVVSETVDVASEAVGSESETIEPSETVDVISEAVGSESETIESSETVEVFESGSEPVDPSATAGGPETVDPSATASGPGPVQPSATAGESEPVDPSATAGESEQVQPSATASGSGPVQPSATAGESEPVDPSATAGESEQVQPSATASGSGPVQPSATAGESEPVDPSATAGESEQVQPSATASGSGPVQPSATAGESEPVDPSATAGESEQVQPSATASDSGPVQPSPTTSGSGQVEPSGSDIQESEIIEPSETEAQESVVEETEAVDQTELVSDLDESAASAAASSIHPSASSSNVVVSSSLVQTTPPPTTDAPEDTTLPPTEEPVDQGDFYPYGTDAGDTQFNQEYPWASKRITFKTFMPFGSTPFSQAYVLLDGAISFGEDRFAWSMNLTQAQGKGKNLLAPFWTLMTYYMNMTVHYHLYEQGDSTTDANTQTILSRASLEVTTHTQDSTFAATTVLVATWDKAIPMLSKGWMCTYYTDAADVPGDDLEYYNTVCSDPPTNTFQAVYVSDGKTAYAIRRYKNMSWKSNQGSEIAIGIVNVDEVIDFLSDGSKPDSIASNKGNVGEIGMYLNKVGEMANQEAECRAFHQSMLASTKNNPNYQIQIDNLFDCPCARSRLGRQWWYLEGIAESSDVYIECFALSTVAKRRLDRLFGVTINKKCCYRIEYPSDNSYVSWYWAWRNAPFIGYGMHAGRILGSDPWSWTSSYRDYIKYDETPLSQCCNLTNTCHLFNEIRPIQQCSTAAEFVTGRALGDPHIKTLDGKDYTMNGWGEYNLVVISDEEFFLQGRTDRLESNGEKINATVFVGFAAEEAGVKFQVLLNAAKDGMDLMAGGTDITNIFKDAESFKESYGEDGLTVTKVVADNRVTAEATFGSGISLSVFKGNGNIEFKLIVPKSLKGKLQGMLGNFNDDGNDEFILPDGTQLATNLTEKEILETFATIWQVNSADSVFTYGDGEQATDYRHDDFVPLYVDEADPAELEAAKTTCGSPTATACIFDYLATKDESFAQATNTINAEAVTENTDLANNLPTLSVTTSTLTEGRWVLTSGTGSTITLIGNDADSDDLTYMIISDVKSQASLANDVVTFTPDFEDPVLLSFQVNDSKGGLSEIVNIPVSVCTGCSSNGECDKSFTRASSIDNANYLLFGCSCIAAYSGDECGTDIDYCSDNPCLEGQECTDKDASIQLDTPVGYICGECPDGFKANLQDSKCSDVDECATNPCTNADCQNTIGSFLCTCKKGYSVVNSTLCKDIDECSQKLHDCEQVCTNTDGAYTCSCNPSYKLKSDDKTCEVDGLLPAGCDVCAHLCNVVGAAYDSCGCRSGYKLDADGKTCVDVDECTEGESPCSQKCDNNPAGSYTCSCYDGFKLNTDDGSCTACSSPQYGTNCESTCLCNAKGKCDPVKGCDCNAGWKGIDCNTNVNECNNNPCGVAQTCVDTLGSYTCTCAEGWVKNGQNCEDIDECASVLTHDCDLSVEICDNTPGTYGCNCKTGFKRGSSGKCEDINECETGANECQQLCDNVVGLYNCRCRYGYRLLPDRTTCEQVGDVCKEYGNLNCSDLCEVNREAETAKCACTKGRFLGVDKETCEDIDECAQDHTNLCSEKSNCANTPGSFNCSCSTGAKLENDGRTCTACSGGTWGPECANHCGCGPNGECDVKIGCKCNEGYTGEQCDEDVDECATGEKVCSGNTVCQNTHGSAVCGCAEGYTKDGTNCVDDDECEAKTDTCSQVCTNTPGSFECSCHLGYSMEGGVCVDVDECVLKLHSCSQSCVNKDGSFICECEEGYKLDYDGTSCSAAVECDPGHSCSDICAKVASVDTCSCPRGKELNGDNSNCDDVDLCATAPCEDGCSEINSNTDIECSCGTGEKLDANGFNCTECVEGKWGAECASTCTCNAATTRSCDKSTGGCECIDGYEGGDCTTNIDECTTGTPCSSQANSGCVDTPGSYICKCQAGYKDSGRDTCVECEDGYWGIGCQSRCDCDPDHTASCEKTDGTCTCAPGWVGTRCDTDKDECTLGEDSCDADNKDHWSCVNTPGRFECQCDKGFVDNSTHCNNLDECLADHTNECDDNGVCVDSAPGYTCTCNAGYTLNATDEHQCLDDDECATNNGGCEQLCGNEDGTFKCSCDSDSTLDDDGLGCTKSQSYTQKFTFEVDVSNITFDPLHATYQTLSKEVKGTMLAFLKSKNPKVLDVIINKLSKGSLVVDATTIFDTSSDADVTGEMIQALIQMSQSQITVNGQPSSPVIKFNSTTIDQNTDRCELLMAVDPCDSGETCVVTNDIASCEGDDDDDLDIPLIVGLSIGIPLLIIIIVLIVVVVYFKTKNKELVRVASREGHYNDNISRPTSAKSNAGLIMNPE